MAPISTDPLVVGLSPVEVGDVVRLLLRFLLGRVCGVALLPEELTVPQKGLRVLKLPPLGEKINRVKYKVTFIHFFSAHFAVVVH